MEVLDPVSSSACEDGHGDEAHDEKEPHSSTFEDDRGDEGHISLAIPEDDEEEPHSSTFKDEGEEDHHISLAISENDEEESHSSTFEDEGEEDHISLAISENDEEEPHSSTFKDGGEEDHISLAISENDEEESHSSTFEDEGEEDHISLAISENDEEESHSSTFEDEGEEDHISLAISENDEEEPHSSTFEDEGEEDRITYSTSEYKREKSLIPFPQDVEKEAHLDWVSSIKQRSLHMPKMLKASSASVSCSIHRVPCALRRHNQNAYDPQLISIGPFHHEKRKGQLRAMEEHKWRYLYNIRSGKPKGWLESCLATIKQSEKRARSCYSEVITLNSDSFVEMMLLDSCFIIEFLRLKRDPQRPDVIFELGWVEEALSSDLLLMENQIPFFIVLLLYGLIYDSTQLVESALQASTQSPFVKSAQEAFTQSPLVESALEFIFPGKSGNMVGEINGYGIQHLLHLLHACYILINNSNIKKEAREPPPRPKRIPCASKLVEAGIRFRKREDSKKKKAAAAAVNDFLDIKFDKGKGVIEIPSILVWSVTQVNFLNIIAFEKCYRPCPKRITSYTFFMDCLINTAKDVEILSKKGIICALGDEEQVACDFNSLAKEPRISYNDFYLSGVCEDIVHYSSRNWPKLRASLVHDYFKNPWALISVFAALLLFMLTMTQTFFASFPKFAIEN